MFIGRESELQYLNDAYRSDKAKFIVLYGRRRVGKTELLNEFCKDIRTALFDSAVLSIVQSIVLRICFEIRFYIKRLFLCSNGIRRDFPTKK